MELLSNPSPVSSVTFLNLVRELKGKSLTDRERIVYGYHFISNEDYENGYKLLGQVTQEYFEVGLFKDLSRALLCHTVGEMFADVSMQREAEFYLVIYRLTRMILTLRPEAIWTIQFFQLKETLFKGFDLSGA